MNSTPSRILLIRPSALGDVCRTVPLLVSLREAFGEAQIDWLVQEEFVPAVEHHPALSHAIPFSRRALGRDLKRGRLGSLRDWLKPIRQTRYDVVIDAQGLARSALIAAASGASIRVGDRRAREGAWLLYNRRIRTEAKMHTVDRMLALLEPLGVPAVRDVRLYTREQRPRLPEIAEDRGYVLVAPTSRWPGKQWPPDRFASVCRSLAGDGVPVVLVGAGSERDQIAPLLHAAEADPVIIDLLGRTSIGALMALVRDSRMVVANDSAALHMAVGFDRPLVALYGPTRVDRVGPYRRETDVLQHVEPMDRMDHKDATGGRRLMERIRTDEVLSAVASRLDGAIASTTERMDVVSPDRFSRDETRSPS